MKFLARYDRLIAIVGTAVLTVGFFLGVLRPGQLKARAIQSEVLQIQSQLTSLPVQIAEREHLQTKLEERREQTERLETRIPFQAEVSDVLHEVAQLARQSQVTITRLEPMPQNDFSSYSALPFTLGCKGEFARVTKFLSGLETQPRLVTFAEVGLTRGADSRDRQVQASVSFSVYSRHANSARIAGNAASQGTSPSDN
ncbi:MAG: type 4a pilus biogenesis protein PilO [Planctomycetota bacterium]